MERTIVGIDVGSGKICTLVSEVADNGNARIIGVGVVPSRGIRRGVVVNVAEATTATYGSSTAACLGIMHGWYAAGRPGTWRILEAPMASRSTVEEQS